MRPQPSNSGLPRYVEHGGEIVYRPPYDALNVRMYAFAVEADRDAIDRYCHSVFNKPSGGQEQWRALSDYVLLNFVNTPTLGSRDPLDCWLGVAAEREAAIWIPLIDLCRLRLAWAVAYMFVDLGIAMAAGREVYGYPKQLGNVHVPRETVAPKRLHVDSVTFARFGPHEQAKRHRVITADTKAMVLGELDVRWDDAGDGLRDMTLLLADPLARRPPPTLGRVATGAVASLHEMLRSPQDRADLALADAELGVLFFEQLELGKLSMVLLKQFRDAVYPASACYQAIIEVANTITAFRQGGFLPDGYSVTFARLAGQPFERELGITEMTQGPRVAFWVEFDFVVDLGALLWQSGGRGRQT